MRNEFAELKVEIQQNKERIENLQNRLSELQDRLLAIQKDYEKRLADVRFLGMMEV